MVIVIFVPVRSENQRGSRSELKIHVFVHLCSTEFLFYPLPNRGQNIFVLFCPVLSHLPNAPSMAEKGEIKLLGTAASPFVNRVQFVLNLKSIEYDFIEENLACKSQLLLTSNPIHKKVPVLFHGNKPPICESLVIIEYLDEIHPDVHPILPSVPSDRANNRFWANYIDNKFFPLFEELRLTQGMEGKKTILGKIIEGSQLLEEAFMKISNGKAYFGGDDIGYLDVVLGCFLGWTKFLEKHNNVKVFDEVKTSGLVGWAKRMWSHEATKGVIPGNETLLNFYMMLQIHKPPRAA